MMLYLNEKDIDNIGIDWHSTVKVIEDTVFCLNDSDFSQPMKLYLRYRDLNNRIIAMPAYIGGEYNIAGLKWIASFPNNIFQGKRRAHSIIVLNSADTGEPVAFINTSKLSCIRTAAVSGLMIQYFLKHRHRKDINIGIIGWGPIGQMHFDMCSKILGKLISNVFLFDLNTIDLLSERRLYKDKIIITNSYEEAYFNADIFITCTVAKEPYIALPPKMGSLQLNVSLRDYKTDIYESVKESIIVDDWTEVCRENTDIENMHLKKGLQEKDVKTIVDVVVNNCMADYNPDIPIMFNPMGLAVFDIAIGSYYLKKACEFSLGQNIV